MALRVLGKYRTVSRNVFLTDTSIEVYDGVDVRGEGVQFDMLLVCLCFDDRGIVNLTNLSVDFYACFKVIGKDPVSGLMADVIERVMRHKEQVTFRHLAHPEHFDSSLDRDWGDLAWDVLESYLVEDEVGDRPVARRSRYKRELVI